MLKSMLVKVPGLVAVAAILAVGHGPVAWAAAAFVVVLASAVLLWPVFDVNSSVWAPTRSRAAGPSRAVDGYPGTGPAVVSGKRRSPHGPGRQRERP